MAGMNDAAQVVEVYKADSKPNAPIEMERAPTKNLATLAQRQAERNRSYEVI